MRRILGTILILCSTAPAPAAEKDIVDTAVAAGFETLVAPTDEAFAKLPSGTVEELLEPGNKDRLKAILTYHVLSGRWTAADVVKLDGKSIETIQGSPVAIEVDG